MTHQAPALPPDPTPPMASSLRLETVALTTLRPHPRNYRSHPPDQLDHLAESIREHGLYRNVVIARDGTILAGHGVVQAATLLGLTSIPVYRLDVGPEDARALKVLTGDNEIEHLGERDDRLLSELLKEIKDLDAAGLLGTGYDDMMLANLVYVTRPASEVATFDAAAEWVGMPEYEEGAGTIRLIVMFRSAEDRAAFLKLSQIDRPIRAHNEEVWSMRWSDNEHVDYIAVKFEG